MKAFAWGEYRWSIKCPKCEFIAEDGWEVRYHDRPHDDAAWASWSAPRLEHLDFSCPNCAYSEMTETADAREKVTP
jgi:predicted RNA-binding Zn-ribbon protein involved in translation (DUF1610 family)